MPRISARLWCREREPVQIASRPLHEADGRRWGVVLPRAGFIAFLIGSYARSILGAAFKLVNIAKKAGSVPHRLANCRCRAREQRRERSARALGASAQVPEWFAGGVCLRRRKKKRQPRGAAGICCCCWPQTTSCVFSFFIALLSSCRIRSAETPKRSASS